jgi:hypothetical protein
MERLTNQKSTRPEHVFRAAAVVAVAQDVAVEVVSEVVEPAEASKLPVPRTTS